MKIGVIGGGSWGTALAMVLAWKSMDVCLWSKEEDTVIEIKKNRTNHRYLPNIEIPENLEATYDMEEAIKDSKIVLFAVPTQVFRQVLNESKKFLKEDQIIVNVAKGIEKGTLLRLSQVAQEVVPNLKYAVLSGPSHAEEVAKKMPTTVTIASKDLDVAREVQEIFFSDFFRTYINHDVIGVELGGALKNIIALGAGISDGMGFGDNAKAALMTRGLTEISRLGIALGANQETFAGLTGMGDLIVTCTSIHSRNRRCGIMIGEGMATDLAVEKVGMVVEGITTSEAAYELAMNLGVEMPITTGIYNVIKGNLTAREAVYQLLTRDKKHEAIQG